MIKLIIFIIIAIIILAIVGVVGIMLKNKKVSEEVSTENSVQPSDSADDITIIINVASTNKPCGKIIVYKKSISTITKLLDTLNAKQEIKDNLITVTVSTQQDALDFDDSLTTLLSSKYINYKSEMNNDKVFEYKLNVNSDDDKKKFSLLIESSNSNEFDTTSEKLNKILDDYATYKVVEEGEKDTCDFIIKDSKLYSKLYQLINNFVENNFGLSDTDLIIKDNHKI